MESFFTKPVGWWATLALAVLVLLAPLLVVDVPPLLDYPNHLARAYVLAFGEDDPVLSRFYAPDWAIIPNLAVDLVLPGLLRFMPVHVAGRVMLAVTLLAPLLGVVFYSRAVWGRRTYWAIASALMAYNALFLMGFMNFLIGAGLGMAAAAAWITLREHRPAAATAATALLALAVFFSHIYGVVFCAILIGSHELVALWREWRAGRPLLGRILARSAPAALAFAPVVALYLNTALHETGGTVEWRALGEKIANLAEPFMNYYTSLDRATALLVFGGVAVALWLRLAAIAAEGAIALLACLALYWVAPWGLKGAGWVDARLPIAAGLLVFAAVLPRLPRRAAWVVSTAVAVLFVLRTGVLAATWVQHRLDLAELRETISEVPPGSRVLVATAEMPASGGRWWRYRSRVIATFSRADEHMPALLVIERRAFWPLMYAVKGQQPIRLLPPYDRMNPGVNAPPPHQLLGTNGRSTWWEGQAPYLAHWRSDFDFVLVLNADGARDDLDGFLPDSLRLLRRTGMAALFRVRPLGPGDAGEAARPSWAGPS